MPRALEVGAPVENILGARNTLSVQDSSASGSEARA